MHHLTHSIHPIGTLNQSNNKKESFFSGTIHILNDDLLWSVSSYGEMLWSIDLPTK